MLARLEELMGKVPALPDDTKQWCLLVQRKTPIVDARPGEEVNDLVVLRDGSTAIHPTMLERLDSFSWRLTSEYASWVAEHRDERGVPAFDSDDFMLLRGARSYDDAITRLGDLVTWVIPRGLEEREAERLAKVRALLGTSAKSATAKKTRAKKKALAKKKTPTKKKVAAKKKAGARPGL